MLVLNYFLYFVQHDIIFPDYITPLRKVVVATCEGLVKLEDVVHSIAEDTRAR